MSHRCQFKKSLAVETAAAQTRTRLTRVSKLLIFLRVRAGGLGFWTREFIRLGLS